METLGKITGRVQHLDHFAIPAMDLVRGETFYSDVLGARTVTKKDYEGSLFMKLGQHHFVLFSQDKTTIPERTTLDSYPRCSFLLPAKDYDETVARIQTHAPRMSQLTDTTAKSCGLLEGVVFMDSEGNLLEAFKADDDEATRLHHLHFDTTHLEDSIAFYTKMLQFELQERSGDIAVLKISENQRLVLHGEKELSVVSKTPYRGRHFAYYVTDDDYHAIVTRLRGAGIKEQIAERDKHGPRDARGDGQLSMYFLDPSAFRLEIVNQDSIYFARKYNFPI
jgi:catechol 2,3-dioxygenase-like lactoylglutathione lyase family enzyme